MSSMSHDNSRRTACDRCRELKLRCPRLEEDSSDTSCTRCDRAGAMCITSSSRPLGRPRITAPISPVMASDERRKRPRESPSHVHTHSVDRAPAWNSMDDYPSFLNTIPTAVTSIFDLPGDRPLRGPSVQSESFDLPFGDDDGLLSSLSTLRHQFSPQSNGANQMGPIDISAGSIDMGAVNRPSGSASVPSETYTFDRLSSQPPIVSLSRLSETISRQISCLDTYTWGGPSEPGPCMDKLNEMSENPIAQALHATADYIKALERLLSPTEMYKSPTTDSAVSLSAPRGLQTPDSLLSPETPFFMTPTLLIILSNYLQLLVLHDAILSRVYQSLCELQDPTKFFQNAPEFSMSIGIPAMKGHLYLKIIIQVIEHHIDHMERLIGLPAEFRLSGQPTTSGILSGNVIALNLLHMAMTQLDCTPKRSGESIVASLKSNLEGVQRLVRS
ncbi:hypothetical protein HD806DRAFT_359087 [Xylariaceae sp. AK1471]|nr:hypothetical protein HD806DRAFT_359087 [Xylariaceae sp. AK1471]